MNTIKSLLLGLAVSGWMAIAVPVTVATALQLPTDYVANTAEEAKSGVDAVGGSGAPPLTDFIKSVINIILYITGIIAVIMVIIGGIKYVTSSGDAQAITSAKNTILYAIIGVVVAIMAFAIVNWVIAGVAPGSGAGGVQT